MLCWQGARLAMPTVSVGRDRLFAALEQTYSKCVLTFVTFWLDLSSLRILLLDLDCGSDIVLTSVQLIRNLTSFALSSVLSLMMWYVISLILFYSDICMF